MSVRDVAVHQYQPQNTVFVKNIDLVEKIKNILKKYPLVKARDIAYELRENRGLINRTLHSYQDIFEKADNNEWFIKYDYIDNTTGADADFYKGFEAEQIASLPLADFREQSNPLTESCN